MPCVSHTQRKNNNVSECESLNLLSIFNGMEKHQWLYNDIVNIQYGEPSL
jgi:hypothetical protein